MTILIFLYGLLIGSFLNLCIYRIPRKKSIAFPSCRYPNYSTSLKWCDLVPVSRFIENTDIVGRFSPYSVKILCYVTRCLRTSG